MVRRLRTRTFDVTDANVTDANEIDANVTSAGAISPPRTPNYLIARSLSR